MIAQWTADVIGKMHLNQITVKELSAVLGYRPEYVSRILNGHRCPKKAEQSFRKALNDLIQQKNRGERRTV